MITSRGLKLVRILGQVSRNNAKINVQQARNHGGGLSYRLPAPPSSTKDLILAEMIGGFAWWWILWHVWHEPDHLTGEFDYPDTSEWSDAELGIPPDDVDN